MSNTVHYKIQKGAPIPKSGRSFGKLIDFAQMEVGDCFTFPQVDEKRVQAMADAYGKKNGAAFIINISTHCTCTRTA